jgi:hypothetical protein
LAAPAKSVAQLLQSAAPFDQWVTAFALPLGNALERVELSAHRHGSNADFLLIESPEPLPLGGDVTIILYRHGAGNTEILAPVIVVSDASQSRSLIVPVAAGGVPVSLAPGDYHIDFALNRSRYAASTVDGDSNYEQVAGIDFTL